MEINKYVRSYLAEGWDKCLPKTPCVHLYTCPLQLGSRISIISIVNDENSAGCEVRSHPDSKAKSLETHQICSLSLTGLDLWEYEDKNCVQSIFPAASTRHWLESIRRVVNSHQLTLKPGKSNVLSLFLNSELFSPRRQWNTALIVWPALPWLSKSWFPAVWSKIPIARWKINMKTIFVPTSYQQNSSYPWFSH